MIQRALDGDELQFFWRQGDALDPAPCTCHAPVLYVEGRRWSVEGIRRVGNSAYAKKHVCSGRMGKGSRAKRIVAKHPTLFGEQPGEDYQ